MSCYSLDFGSSSISSKILSRKKYDVKYIKRKGLGNKYGKNRRL
jgi:hypothetical protein